MNVKRKGSEGEREIVDILNNAGIRSYRNDQIFRGGKNNPDVSAEFAEYHFHVEVKRCEKLNIHEAMKQAMNDASENHIPVVAHRRNRETWLVTIPLSELLKLLGESVKE